MKIIKIIGKIVGWTLISLLMLMLLVLLAIQTKPVKEIIANTAQEKVNKILNAQLYLGEMKGNFVSGLSFDNIVLKYNSDTIAYIDELKVKYRLLPLLRKTISVEKIELNNPVICVEQYADSSWNFQHITKPNQNPKTKSSTFNLKIKLNEFAINNGRIQFNTLDTIIPRSITNWNTELSLLYSQSEQEFDLRKFQFQAHQPDLLLQNITFFAKRNSALVSLENFILQTKLNKITAEATLYPTVFENSEVELNADSIHAEEFQFLFPDIQFIAHPTLALSGKLKKNNSTLSLSLNNKEQYIGLTASSDNAIQFLQDNKNNDLLYLLDGKFENINSEQWIKEFDTYRISNGVISASGKGLTPETMKIEFKAKLKKLMVMQRDAQYLSIDFNYDSGNIKGKLDGAGSFGAIHISPTINNLLGNRPSYQAFINTQKLDLSRLMLNNSFKSNLNLNTSIKGSGINPKTISAVINGEITNSQFMDYTVGQLGITLNFLKGNLNGSIEANGDFGKIKITPSIQQIMSDRPKYMANLSVENLNLAALTSKDSLASDMNFLLDIEGVGFNPKQLSAHVGLHTYPSSLLGVNIQRLSAEIDYLQENIELHSLLLKTETIDFDATGNYNMNGNSDLNLNVNLLDTKELSKFLNIDSLKLKGTLQANVSGQKDSLMATANFQLDSLLFRQYTASSIVGQASGLLSDKDTLLNARISGRDIFAAGFLLDSLQLHANSNLHQTDFTLGTQGKEVYANLAGNISSGDSLYIQLNNAKIGYRDSNWLLTETPSSILIADDKYEINNLKFISNIGAGLDSIQILSADGIIRRQGEQNLDIRLFNLNIPSTLGLLDIQPAVKGTLDVNLYVRGSAEAPKIEGGFNVNNGSFNDYNFTEIAGTIGYLDNKMSVDVGVIPQDSGIFEIIGYIPLEIRLDSMNVITPSEQDSINLQVTASKVPLKIIDSFYPTDKIEGYLQSNIIVNGSLNNLRPRGSLQLINGALQLKKYGVDYKKIRANIGFENESVKVDTILIKSKNGYMFANGAIGFNSQFYQSDIKNSEINIEFNKFHPFNHKYYNMEMSGDAALHGKKDSLFFDGDVNIIESLIYLPAIMNLIGSGTPAKTDKPLLISKLEEEKIMLDSVIYQFRTNETNKDSVKFDYFDNLQGKIKVYIPRNTWIKNEHMRLELSGDIEVLKHKSFMELFGTVDVIRGQYELLGKTFVVDEGTITFQGGEEFNPRLDVVASYTVRSESSTSNKITINVTGELKEPKITFMMNDEQLTEGDALSYILFGTNMDALTSGQQAALSSETTASSIATGAAASLISSELTKLLGKTLNVDYIEMKAGSSLKNATFVVGKYITNKLFLSYARRFGDFKDENIAEYEMTLEYELFRYLFLQLASSPNNNGADIIFKINSKTKFKEK